MPEAAPGPASPVWPQPSRPLPWNCQQPRGAAGLASVPQLLQPLLLGWRLARWLGCREATEPGHVAWSQAEPLPRLQSHTSQDQLCSLKSLEPRARLLPQPWAAVDSYLPPGWETEPCSEQESGRSRGGRGPQEKPGPASSVVRRGTLHPVIPSVRPLGRSCAVRGSTKQGICHSCGSCQSGSRHKGLHLVGCEKHLPAWVVTVLGALTVLTAAILAKACWHLPPGSSPGLDQK